MMFIFLSNNSTHFDCPRAGVLAPKVLVVEPNAGGGAEAGVPNPKDVCGAPNASAEIVI